QPVREPRVWPVRESARDRIAIDVLISLDVLLVDFGHIQQEAAERAVQSVRQVLARLAARRRTTPQNAGGDRLLGAGRPQLAALVPQADFHVEALARLVADVAAAAEPIFPVIVHRAFVPIPSAEEEVAHRLEAAREGGFVCL